VVEDEGAQTSQLFEGLLVPDTMIAPPMKQSDAQVPALQTSPDAQPNPSLLLVNAVVDALGVQA
jgi:hypothetical protein